MHQPSGKMTAIFQSSNPTWIEEGSGYRIYSQIEQILSDNSVREVHVVTAWMSIQALDAFTGILTEIAGRNGARVVFVLGNQPPLSRLTDEAVFDRLLTWDENHESIEAYVHSAGTGNKIFHPKFFCFRDRKTNWRMIAGSANMTLSGLGIESGAGLNPNTEFVVVGNLEGETRQQVLDILEFLGNNENSISLNSDEGRTFVESYQKTRIGGNGQPSGTTLEQDQAEDDDFNQYLLEEEPEEEEPEEEEPEEEEQGLYPLPRDLTELTQQELCRTIDHYVGSTLGVGDTCLDHIYVRRTDGMNNSGHFLRECGLTSFYLLNSLPFDLLRDLRGIEYGQFGGVRWRLAGNAQNNIRIRFTQWLEEINENEQVWTQRGNPQVKSVGQIAASFNQVWGGGQNGATPYNTPRILHWVANHLWDPEINPAPALDQAE